MNLNTNIHGTTRILENSTCCRNKKNTRVGIRTDKIFCNRTNQKRTV